MLEVVSGHVFTVLGFCLGVVLIIRVLRQRYRPSVAIAWFLMIILVPYLGVPAYLLLGGRKMRRLAGRKGDLPKSGSDEPPGGQRQRAARVLLTSGMPPARLGNRIELIHHGVEAYKALERLILEAERSIHVMTFILGRKEVAQSIVELLARRAGDGVQVRLMLDALGSLRTRGRFVSAIHRAGGEVAVFMPVLPLRRKWSANLRNHRKMVIADGRKALVGGMNLSREYMGPTPWLYRWMDTSTEIEGPSVCDLERLFANDWAFATGRELAPPEAVPAPPHEGDGATQVVASGPDTEGDPLYDAMLSALYETRERVWIATPYFIPDDGLLKALLIQARLGHDVRIMLPERSNHVIADLTRGPALRDLKNAGARIYLLHGRMNHGKHMVFDRDLAMAGSVNFDMRSLYLNYEVALFMYSSREVEQVADWMRSVMGRSREVDELPSGHLREWTEDLASLVSPLL